MSEWWRSTQTGEPQVMTYEKLKAAFDEMRERGRVPHGTPDSPHIVSPTSYARGEGFCHECGYWWKANP